MSTKTPSTNTPNAPGLPSIHSHRAPAATRRGYLLPLTLLLLTVVGVLAATVAERQINSANTVNRQLNAYREHHGAMGLQTAVQMWLRVQRASSIAGLLGENGHAFDLEFEDGSTIRIFLHSAQGTALTNLGTVDTEDLSSAARIVATLNSSLPGVAFDAMTRQVGPVAVDLAWTEQAVLNAVVQGITDDPQKAELLAIELFNNRAGATRNTLTEAASNTGLDSDERARLYRLITTSTTLYRVHLEIRRGLGQGEVVGRYEGITELNTSGSGLNQNFTVSGGFLEWGAVPLDQLPGPGNR